MSAFRAQSLPAAPAGFRLYESPEQIGNAPELFAWQHLLLRAWEAMKLSAVLTFNGLPTVYVRDHAKRLSAADVAKVQCQFWNQGIATVLLLRDSEGIRVVSSMARPVDAASADKDSTEQQIVESVGLATQAAWAVNFYAGIASGHYYNARPEKFDPKATVDAWLMANLESVRDRITSGEKALLPTMAHAFLGRILFASYLCHRGIIKLSDYFPGQDWKDLRALLAGQSPAEALKSLYGKLFPALRQEFNSSMFDDDLTGESERVQPGHLEAISKFLDGSEVRKGQGSLGFWAYDFSFIPVETISAIYEKFLKAEDSGEKRKKGAFYTPRLLAEMTLDQALHDRSSLVGLRAIDPSCGSGIFLVILFNRMAAAWSAEQKRKPSPAAQAKALKQVLAGLRGVDQNLTACRIACFSLYLAYLNQFDPAGVREYMKATGEKLPNLLVAKGAKKPDLEVIWHRDFLEVAHDWSGQFDLVLGNPPWAERGSKQLANRFMELSPGLLASGGTAVLILPSKVFFNKTDDFQSRWLRTVTVETLVQLADFRFILFKEALCPAAIVRFTAAPPPLDHVIEYITPKVRLTDLRDGVIAVSPQDRKWLRLSRLLEAAASKEETVGMVWKSRLWGTPRDQKLLDYLFTLPRLSALAGTVKEYQTGTKRWCKGIGFQPLKVGFKSDNPQPLIWDLSDRFVSFDDFTGLPELPASLTSSLGDHLRNGGYRLDALHRTRDEQIYHPPLVLLNRGFTESAFFDYPTRFRHAATSFSGPPRDADDLRFLAAFLRSKLARYFVFHTAASLGTERDQVHSDEALRLPFFLPDHEEATPECAWILKEIVTRFKRLKSETDKSAATLMKKLNKQRLGPLFDDDGDKSDAQVKAAWFTQQQAKAAGVQREFEPLLYRYFGLTEQDIALVEDTCDIFDKSATPGSLETAAQIPTLKAIDADTLQPYADMLCTTLNGWATGPMKASAHGTTEPATGLALLELRQTKTAEGYKYRRESGRLAAAMQELQEASKERRGSIMEYLRTGWYFDGTRIIILKPARLGEWTRTAALNDAAEIHAQIAAARHAGKS